MLCSGGGSARVFPDLLTQAKRRKGNESKNRRDGAQVETREAKRNGALVRRQNPKEKDERDTRTMNGGGHKGRGEISIDGRILIHTRPMVAAGSHEGPCAGDV
ncbi:hypothetical protein EXIGLDRAFT_125439 [Exidia glandulosa HHB12029]|uniref:Uncharacterized protein n=1 Tax=Exidia glandulosa HHB12029 TaxID=1314781 RepID=A0A165GAE7_EXIGL|nr:hypothetical protein EXIGLDRAFT_125439 [Exidia glandulosa HHB12029]